MKAFTFWPIGESRASITFPPSLTLHGYISRAGRRVFVLPHPFEAIQIVEGERVGRAKMHRIRDAVAALGGSFKAESV